MEKPLCRWCGEEIRKATREGKDAGYRHVEQDNGRCEAQRRIITGDAKTPIEAA